MKLKIAVVQIDFNLLEGARGAIKPDLQGQTTQLYSSMACIQRMVIWGSLDKKCPNSQHYMQPLGYRRHSMGPEELTRRLLPLPLEPCRDNGSPSVLGHLRHALHIGTIAS